MSQAYEIEGAVKFVGEMETLGAKGFTKRELIVTTPDEKYPQDLKIEFVKDNCSKLDDISVGDEVTVAVNLRGSEYNGKYYPNVNAWAIDRVAPTQPYAPQYSAPSTVVAPSATAPCDDLPF